MPDQGDAKKKQREAKEVVLERLAVGDAIAAAMRHVKRDRKTFYVWSETDTRFGERARSIIERVAAGEVAQERDGPLPFEEYRKTYFGLDTFAHQQKVVEAFEDAPPGSVTLVLLPPEAGKTSVVEDYICYLLSYRPNSRNVVISEGMDHAKKIVGKIKHRMEDDESFFRYHRDFGPFHATERAIARTWNANQITILARKGDERDYSLECRGSGSRIYGARFDNVFLDDIQSVASINDTKNLLAKYRQDWRTRPGKAGRIFITGTRVGNGDFYGELAKSLPNLRMVIIPAIVEVDLDDGTVEQRSYFPAVYDPETGERVISDAGEPLGWTLAELETRKEEVTEGVFDMVYLMKTRVAGLQAFLEDEIRSCFDVNLFAGPPHTGFNSVIGVDPAIEGVCAFVVASYTSERLHLENLVAKGRLGRNEAIFDELELLVRQHHPSHVVIEKNAMQGGIARDQRLLEMAKKYGFFVIEHQTNDNKWDQIIGVKSMSAAFKRHEIIIPAAAGSADIFEPLVMQLLDWREDIPTRRLKQDMVMALWFVWLFWSRMKHSLSMTSSMPQRGGLSGWNGSRGLPGYAA